MNYPTKLCAPNRAKKHWGSSSFLDLVKARAQASNSNSTPPEPLKKPPAPSPDFAVPQYKPEPTLVDTRVSREVLTPGAVTEWSRDSFSWSEKLVRINSLIFHNETFKPCQKEIINAVLAGRNVFACMPTGAGKSLLYQLPALLSPGFSLVVMPLVALIKDQVDFLVAKGLRAKAFLGTMSASEQTQIYELLQRDEVQILLVTPEKIASSGILRDIVIRKFQQGKLDRLVIDEAHCISTWGTDFRADYLKLADLTAAMPALPVLCLTSTAPSNVREDIITRLCLCDPLCFVTSLNRPNLDYQILRKDSTVWAEAGKLIRDNFSGQSGIVYCLARDECVTFAKKLRRQFGISAGPYHAQMPDAERTRVQDAWIRGDLQVVVATIAFGLGINKADVRFVIHTSFPKSMNDYYQESGRAGRDGASSNSIVYYTYRDKARMDFLLQNSHTGNITRQYQELSKMIAFCEDRTTCRRQMILSHFGEHIAASECEQRCDNCRAGVQVHEEDVTPIAETIYTAVESSNSLSLLQLVQLLTGAGTREVLNPCRGNLQREPQERLRRIINLLCAQDVLAHIPMKIGTICFTALRLGSTPLKQVRLSVRGERDAAYEALEDVEPPAGSLKRPDCPFE